LDIDPLCVFIAFRSIMVSIDFSLFSTTRRQVSGGCWYKRSKRSWLVPKYDVLVSESALFSSLTRYADILITLLICDNQMKLMVVAAHCRKWLSKIYKVRRLEHIGNFTIV
jgi:hypothetical protein